MSGNAIISVRYLHLAVYKHTDKKNRLPVVWAWSCILKNHHNNTVWPTNHTYIRNMHPVTWNCDITRGPFQEKSIRTFVPRLARMVYLQTLSTVHHHVIIGEVNTDAILNLLCILARGSRHQGLLHFSFVYIHKSPWTNDMHHPHSHKARRQWWYTGKDYVPNESAESSRLSPP